jgi:hypothetical protein
VVRESVVGEGAARDDVRTHPVTASHSIEYPIRRSGAAVDWVTTTPLYPQARDRHPE